MRGLSLTLKLTRRVSNVFEIEVRTTLCAGCLRVCSTRSENCCKIDVVIKLITSKNCESKSSVFLTGLLVYFRGFTLWIGCAYVFQLSAWFSTFSPVHRFRALH